MRIILFAGHHEAAKGAVNEEFDLNEFDEASKVVTASLPLFYAAGHSVVVCTGPLSYKIKMVNRQGFDLALDLHFNAGGGTGCEVLYMPDNIVRQKQAQIMSQTIAKSLKVRNRGAKPGYYQQGPKAGKVFDAFVSKTVCPAFILEPLFLDDKKDVKAFLVANKHEDIAKAIVQSVDAAFS